MPAIDVQIMEGVFSDEDKRRMIERITEAFGEVAGRTMQDYTTVRIREVPSGSWGYAGRPITTEDARAWRAKG